VTRLYVVPVGDDWIQRFNDTVASPVSVPVEAPEDLQKQTEARIWGTTDGNQKRTFFEEMETGDPLLFYNDGEFFAAGRVGAAFENPSIGDALWDNPDSQFIYTVTDYQEISVDRERIAQLLGYEDNWVPYRFLRVSQDAVSSLLREYNSIEEAFQDFHNGGTMTHQTLVKTMTICENTPKFSGYSSNSASDTAMTYTSPRMTKTARTTETDSVMTALRTSTSPGSVPPPHASSNTSTSSGYKTISSSRCSRSKAPRASTAASSA